MNISCIPKLLLALYQPTTDREASWLYYNASEVVFA